MEIGTGPHTQPDDLVERCAAGDERAFEELARRFRIGMLGTARQVVDPDAADDVVQLALIEVNKELRRGTRPEHLGAWVRGITRNVAREQLRSRLRTPPTFPVASASTQAVVPSAHDVAADRETVRGMVAGVEEELTDLQRTAFVGHVLEGKSHKQIALEEGVSAGSVRMAIARAREKMRRRLGALFPLPFLGAVAALARKALPKSGMSGGTVATGAATVAVAAVAATAAITVSSGGEAPAELGGEPPQAQAAAPPALAEPSAERKPTKEPAGKPKAQKKPKPKPKPAPAPAPESSETAPAPAPEPSRPAPQPDQSKPSPPPPSVTRPPVPNPQPPDPAPPVPDPPLPPPDPTNCGTLNNIIPCVAEIIDDILSPRVAPPPVQPGAAPLD